MSFYPTVEWLETRDYLSIQPLSVGAMRNAYEWSQTPGLTNHATYNQQAGKGQTVAIVDAYADPYVQQELRQFSAYYGLPFNSHTVSVVNQGTAQDHDWQIEEALDVEWVHAMAPAAHILVINANDSSGQALLSAESYAVNHVHIVSNSWGAPAFLGDSGLSFFFQSTTGNQRVTVCCAAGDSPQVFWPADMNRSTKPPVTISVGGTTISTGLMGKYLSESTWPLSGLRSNVGYDADPASGVPIRVVNAAHPNGEWGVVGGTSLSAPCEAAFIALADEMRVTHHLLPLTNEDFIAGLRQMPRADMHRSPNLPGVGSLRVGAALEYFSLSAAHPVINQIHQAPVVPPVSVEPLLSHQQALRF